MAGTGETVTYAMLKVRANQGARVLRFAGLKPGDGMAVLLDNSPRYLELLWAAERIGVHCTCIAAKLTAAEAAYIVRNGAGRVLIAGAGVAALAQASNSTPARRGTASARSRPPSGSRIPARSGAT